MPCSARDALQGMKGNGLVLSPVAQTGFASAAAYDKSRPSYSDRVVDQLLHQLLRNRQGRGGGGGGGGSGNGSNNSTTTTTTTTSGSTSAKIVLDLAAGTGKLTERLAARPEKLEIIAVEPHDGMREQLEKKELRGVRVLKGTAENLTGIEDNSIAAVTAAQAFHWFANRDALKEIHRVLEPAGGFGMVWNIEDYNAPLSWRIHTGWETVMRDVVWSFHDAVPRFRHEKWRQAFDSQDSGGDNLPLFTLPLGEGIEEFETWLSKEEIWNRILTLSQIAILEGEELDKVRRTFDHAINSDETVTDDQGRVAVHGRTYFAWTTSIPNKSAS